MRAKAATLALALLLPACAHAQRAETPVLALRPVYADTPDSLKQLMQDMLASTRAGDARTFAAQREMLALPSYHSWFEFTFGRDLGILMADAHSRMRESFTPAMDRTFAMLLREGFTGVEVSRFDQACVPEADAQEYPVLAARVQRVPLYAVRFFHGSVELRMWFFAFADGAFRYLGPVAIEPPPRWLETIFAHPAGIPGATLPATATVHVAPPATEKRIAETVRFWAILNRHGDVLDLHLLEGSCSAAQEAEWTLRHTHRKLRNVPVETNAVYATIEVSGFRPQ